jgi:hypothetical protein
MRRTRLAIDDLRTAIDCLPTHTRVAMLQGVRANPIIAGAYVDRDGGVCPMLAAHRCGGRTDFISFARAWDGFTRPGRRARRATEREVRVLVSHLEASLLSDSRPDLANAIADHERLVARSAAEAPTADRIRPGDPSRAHELRDRAGWSWLRPFRRLDDYERAIARVEEERAALEERDRDLELV